MVDHLKYWILCKKNIATLLPYFNYIISTIFIQYYTYSILCQLGRLITKHMVKQLFIMIVIMHRESHGQLFIKNMIVHGELPYNRAVGQAHLHTVRHYLCY
jgi:hypothetical protein